MGPDDRTAETLRASAMDVRALARVRRRLLRAQQVPWLHEEAARRMGERLPLIRAQPSTVIDWSGPLGASAAVLRSAYPSAALRAVRPADAPAAAARPGPRWWPWRRDAAEALSPDEVGAGSAELLWSNMVLHAAVDPPQVFAQWHRALAVGGFLMFSTLGPGTLSELREIHASQGWGEPMAPFVDMHDLGDQLVAAGFADPVMDQETLTLTWPDARAVLRELRGLGGNVSSRRFAGLRTPRWRARLLQLLAERALDGRPSLSFELVYGHAFRAAPRVRVAGEASVSLDEMRAMVRQPPRGPA